MTTTILIIFCILLLTAYLFDITASKTRIPSVLLLMLLGWTAQQLAGQTGIQLPELQTLLPVLGTIGLILIVLEGSLELNIQPEKLPLIRRSFYVASIPLFVLAFGIAGIFSCWLDMPYKSALSNAIPLAIISSAIAIPSARNLSVQAREFITYESSFSDIIGVILFNFITANEVIGLASGLSFIGQILLILAVTAIATALLAFLLRAINHHIKFTPIILMVILIYALTKLLHLPGLLFILIFGLFLANLEQLRQPAIHRLLQPEALAVEVHKFKEIVTEIAFLVRSLFFLVFGYLIDTRNIIDLSTFPWAAGICAAIFTIRYIALKLTRQPAQPLLFIAPRGLITILLFLSVPMGQELPIAGNALVIQVILISGILMMGGLLFHRPAETSTETE